jgi:hypothetical protein
MSYTLQKYQHYRRQLPRDSDRIVRAAWRQYCAWLRGAIDDPACDEDVIGWLESIISERVNNPRSVFWLRG